MDYRKVLRHGKMLHKAPPEAVRLAAEVERRFLDFCTMFLRVTGTKFTMPRDFRADMLLYREMCLRFKRGDYRNNLDEIQSMERVMRFLSEERRILADQEAMK